MSTGLGASSTSTASATRWGLAPKRSETPKPPATASSTDRRFVQEAGAGGAAEVALSKLAAQKVSRDDVKQFGQQMVADHSKSGDELKQVPARRA